MKTLLLILLFVMETAAQSTGGFQIARLKYNGGGDWYNDPSAEVNLLDFIEKNTSIKVKAEYKFVEISSNDIFSYPFLFMTGHGNIVFSESEANRLRQYLDNGGFLYVDDDYGLDKAFRREIKKVFPDNELVELPFNHPIYNIFYDFEFGPPKIHEHDNKPPRGFAIYSDGRMVIYYTYESNPGDGWADPEIHNNPPEVREKALRFGTNLVVWALSN